MTENMSQSTSPGQEHPGDSIPPLKIAVEGCGHGALDLIYGYLEAACKARDWTTSDLDFLIICGDFEALRNERDLNCMAVPPRYRHMGDFHKYYSGKKRAPVLTLVIGGNHEAANYFSELHHGGWLAPNMYYLGDASVIRYGPYRIAGLSGIFKAGDYRKKHFERLPYSKSDIHSIFHVREEDVDKLLQVHSPIDICLSHDWPSNIEWGGDAKTLFRERPHFFESVRNGAFGSEPAEKVLSCLRPRYWFSGHMHIKYTAVVDHDSHPPKGVLDSLDMSNKTKGQLQRALARRKKDNPKDDAPSGITNAITQFLALDKPGPDREFLELLEITPCYDAEDLSTKPYMQRTPEGKLTLHYDEEWLSIVRANLIVGEGIPETVHDNSNAEQTESLSHNLHWVRENVRAKGLLKVPENFERHAPVYDPNNRTLANEQPAEYPNSQTVAFCKLLGIKNKFENGERERVDERDVVTEDDYVVFG